MLAFVMLPPCVVAELVAVVCVQRAWLAERTEVTLVITALRLPEKMKSAKARKTRIESFTRIPVASCCAVQATVCSAASIFQGNIYKTNPLSQRAAAACALQSAEAARVLRSAQT